MPDPALPFVPYGPSHVAALLCTGLAAVGLIWLSRRRPDCARPLQLALAWLMALEWPLTLAAYAWSGEVSRQNALPLHLCDVAALLAAVALAWRQRLAAELAYFFGLAGTLQGLLTPNLVHAWPHPRFFTFFLTHGGVVVAALTLANGMGLGPRAGAVTRALGWLLGYALLVGLANAALGTNYGFLCAKPPVASALDLLGPWPWYLGGIVGVAGLLFLLLDAPFAWQRHQLAHRAK